MSENRFMGYLIEKAREPIEFTENRQILLSNKHGENPPMRLNLRNGRYSLSADRTEAFTLPEPIIHYLLLYNLSMIARYETEWWSEMLKSNSSDDYPFIKNFLHLSLEKPAILIGKFLLTEM